MTLNYNTQSSIKLKSTNGTVMDLYSSYLQKLRIPLDLKVTKKEQKHRNFF